MQKSDFKDINSWTTHFLYMTWYYDVRQPLVGKMSITKTIRLKNVKINKINHLTIQRQKITTH